MSAIAGIYRLDGRAADAADLARMQERLSLRGRDRAATWLGASVGLGHRMLWTTPESVSERLPLVDPTGDLVITADARLDNRAELAASLGLSASAQGQVGDGELILCAYGRWGERCAERLLGDFAFAVWDARGRVLFCARDHFGVRPFYYYRSPDLFAFASEIKALLSLQEVPRRLNEERVADYLVPILEDKAATFYRDVLRLPPAHVMSVGPGGVSSRRYWALDPGRETRLGSDGEYAEAFRDAFTEAVRCRLRSAYPIGSMLSGGLDSSSIVCVARRLLADEGRNRLRTYSAVFDDLPQCDERAYIDAVLSQNGVEPHFVRADRLRLLAALDRVADFEDEPICGPYMVMHLALYGLARQQGVRVLLHGVDGDAIVSHGFAHLPVLARAGRWIALAREVDGLARNFGRSRREIVWARVLKPLAPTFVREAWRRVRGRGEPWAINSVASALIHRDFARRVGLADRVRALQGERSKAVPTARDDHWRRLGSGVFPLELEVSGRAAAAFSLEFRYPFFDVRLAQFCLGLPPEQKLSHGWTRVVMRRALAGVLPERVRWRGGKVSFAPLLTRAMFGLERELVTDVIRDESKVIEQYVDVVALREIHRRCAQRGAAADGESLNAAYAIWNAVTLAHWLGRAGAPPAS